jgi:hypothetical protein
LADERTRVGGHRLHDENGCPVEDQRLIHVRVSPQLHEALYRRAASEDRPLSQVIREALRRHLEVVAVA